MHKANKTQLTNFYKKYRILYHLNLKKLKTNRLKKRWRNESIKVVLRKNEKKRKLIKFTKKMRKLLKRNKRIIYIIKHLKKKIAKLTWYRNLYLKVLPENVKKRNYYQQTD